MNRHLPMNYPTFAASREQQLFRRFLLLCCIFAQAAFFAAEPAPKAAIAPKYRLEVVRVHGMKPEEQMLVLLYQGGGVAFKSVAELQGSVGTLGRDSSIEWAPSCDAPRAGSPFASDREVKSFAEHCAKLGIVFTRVPSG